MKEGARVERVWQANSPYSTSTCAQSVAVVLWDPRQDGAIAMYNTREEVPSMTSTCRLPQAVDAQSPQHLAPFRALDPCECANVAPEISGYRYHDATALPYPDDLPGTLYLVGSGRVRLYRPSPDGEAVLLLSLSAGDCFRLSARDAAGHLRRQSHLLEATERCQNACATRLCGGDFSHFACPCTMGAACAVGAALPTASYPRVGP